MRKKWQIISNLGVSPDMSLSEKRKIILVNQLSIVLFIIFTLLNFSIHFFYVPLPLPSLLSGMPTLIGPLLNRFGLTRLSAILLSCLTPVLTLIAATHAKLDVFESVPIYGYIFPRVLLISYITLPFIFIDKKQKWCLWSSVGFNFLFVFAFDPYHKLVGVDFFQVGLETQSYYLTNFFIVFPMLAILLGFIFLTNINSSYESKVLQLVDALEEKNKKITDSIVYAERIQNTFLPDGEYLKDKHPNTFVYFRPRDIVSGDFYWMSKQEKKQIVIAADCTGHGVPGALLSILGSTLLNEIIINQGFMSPSGVLEELRNRVKKALKQTGTSSEQKDGMDVSVCIIDHEKKVVEFSGANNSAFIVRDKNLITLSADRQPIGIYPKETSFNQQQVLLEKNDMIYLFSDGYVSQFSHTNKEKFKTSRFKELLKSIANQPLQSQRSRLGENIQAWVGANGYIDDILVIGVRV